MYVGSLGTDARRRRRPFSLGSATIGSLAILLEILLVMALSVATGLVWHAVTRSETGDLAAFAGVGLLTGLLYTLPFVYASDYRIERFLAGSRSHGRVLHTWTYAFFCLAVLAFLTKTTGLASRGWLALFFGLGAAGVVGANAALRSGARGLTERGIVTPRRIVIVGKATSIRTFVERNAGPASGIEVVATAVLPDRATAFGDVAANELDAVLASAVTQSRNLDASEVLVLVEADHTHAFVSRLADRFLDLPVAVHIGRLPLADQFPSLKIDSIGSQRTVSLRDAPLDTFQLVAKRCLDVVVAALGLLLLAPLFAVVAVLIKLDSKGPVIFRQRRRGFNQREFLIWKFRSMTTQDDGDRIDQARANDPRITRVGAWLRRFNIDELPQLVNVLVGDMSLVGPRPHAVAHDRHYERIIRRYQRRLNVKPGITGWAQVNGFRGLTDSQHAMRSRITHDLYYIDNWSLLLDLYILVLTVISPKAFRNAV